jgi:hypothetical protein
MILVLPTLCVCEGVREELGPRDAGNRKCLVAKEDQLVLERG